jgi:uncharacterized Fe-S cluster-containing protein
MFTYRYIKKVIISVISDFKVKKKEVSAGIKNGVEKCDKKFRKKRLVASEIANTVRKRMKSELNNVKKYAP